ncbi:ribosomal protein S16 [Capsaspora owczarzaki ATCC 30864]|nr:ribosomal protein S16 [Capsaspora owczarzaki ATCC 30864]|eukprot:XP_004365532.2 ribosomal protein S16 [Capsaspora owczarzaki ATCC 30864]
MLMLRLARFGQIHHPVYRIVVGERGRRRDGKHLEHVGTYHPEPDTNGVRRVTWKVDRIKYWLSVGAQPTERVGKLLGLAGILPLHPRTTSALHAQAITPSVFTYQAQIRPPSDKKDEPAAPSERPVKLPAEISSPLLD